MSETFKWARPKPPPDLRQTQTLLHVLCLGFVIFAVFQVLDVIRAAILLDLSDIVMASAVQTPDSGVTVQLVSQTRQQLWRDLLGSIALLTVAVITAINVRQAKRFSLCAAGAFLVMTDWPLGLGLGLVAVFVLLTSEVRTYFSHPAPSAVAPTQSQSPSQPSD